MRVGQLAWWSAVKPEVLISDPFCREKGVKRRVAGTTRRDKVAACPLVYKSMQLGDLTHSLSGVPLHCTDPTERRRDQ
jgi:hypothetical protein